MPPKIIFKPIKKGFHRWKSENNLKNFGSKSLNEEYNKFNNLVKNYEVENKNLKELISYFKDINSIYSQKSLINDFEKSLNEIIERIENRTNIIN